MHICLGTGNAAQCVPGNCHDRSQDCVVPGQICGITTPHVCGSCAGSDAACKGDPYYTNGRPRGNGPGKDEKFALDSPEDRARLVTFDDALSRFNSRKYTGLGIALGRLPDASLHLSGIDLE
jgi:hypothetical protein